VRFERRYEVVVRQGNPFDPALARKPQRLNVSLFVEVTAGAPARATVTLRAP
jgi:hypothetical protein